MSLHSRECRQIGQIYLQQRAGGLSCKTARMLHLVWNRVAFLRHLSSSCRSALDRQPLFVMRPGRPLQSRISTNHATAKIDIKQLGKMALEEATVACELHIWIHDTWTAASPEIAPIAA